jgi:endonuclease YncB( thermonuclease family)
MSPANRSWRYRRFPPARRSKARRYAEYGLTFAILILLLVIVTRFDRVETRTLGGQAVVNDGDSLTINGARIRLRGIDAPEFSQTCMRNGQTYPCGREARQALQRSLVLGVLSCEGWERDKFGRLLAVCRAGSVDLNRRQVELGWAISYGDYFAAENEARAAKRGLWAGSFEQPRAWRDRHGHVGDVEHSAVQAIFNWLRQLIIW